MAKRKPRVKANIPANETKAMRFVRVVRPRVNKAIKSIGTVGYCASSSYEFTPQQVKDIINSLIMAVQSVETKYMSKDKSAAEFKFTG